MKATDIVSAIKEFFFEIIGFLIPGFILMLILSICVKQELFLQSKLMVNDSNSNWLIVIISSYVLGYIVYSLGEARDYVFSMFPNFIKLEDIKSIRKSINQSVEANISKNILLHLIVSNPINTNNSSPITQQNIFDLETNSLRNLAMSYAPDADAKVYNFMYRSELCSQLSTLLFGISIVGILSCVFTFFFCKQTIFLTDTIFLMLYILFFLSSIILYKARTRFYGIAFRIPFSIFIAKFHKIL